MLVDAYPAYRSPYYYQQWQLLFDCIDMIWQLAHRPFHEPLEQFETFSTSYHVPSVIAYINAKVVDRRPASTVEYAIRAFSDTAKIVAYEDRLRVPFYIRLYVDESNDFVGQGCILRETATNATNLSKMNGTVAIPSDQKNGAFAGEVAFRAADLQLIYLGTGKALIGSHVLLIAARAIAFCAYNPLPWYVAHNAEYIFPATVPDIQINIVKAWTQSPLNNKDVVDALRSMAFKMWENGIFAEADLEIRTNVAGRRIRIATLQIRHRISADGLATN
ncbi:MAG: hypothetical protein Q9191_007553 [Dirinaria sp. TL-2023a]